jgi:quinolinate synthase
MKLNTMEKLFRCMRDKTPRLEMPDDLREAALKPLKLMLEWS